MRVFLFQPRFHDAIRAGTKCQTIRRLDKRGWEYCSRARHKLVSLRKWTGAPYRSKQEELAREPIISVDHVVVDLSGVIVYTREGGALMLAGMRASALDWFARDDGFDSWEDMRAWFDEHHGLPFSGVLYRWGVVTP